MAKLNLIIKADVNGSLDGILTSLKDTQSKDTTLNIIHAATGPIHENDIMLAKASNALIVGFHVTITPEAQTQPTTGFWSSITGKSPSAGDEELRKEMQGLRDDLAKLNAEANGRKDLAPGENSGLLQFFGPKNALEPDGALQVKNVKLNKSESEWFLDFEITNTDPEQKQVRGYIVVLAKTPNMLLSYPEGAFNPDQNIVLDFTKGETFGVSRLRPTRATFLASALEGKNPRFHVLLFNTAGKVVSDFHVEGK